jgi:RNA polymerase sigma factor (sigma-70 family)
VSTPSDDHFATTRWSAVLSAGSDDATRAGQALAQLCQTYWYPLYAYARRRGHSPHDAEDLTQGFFARLLRLNSLADLSPERGKFRAFLLASMNHYLADERARAGAQRRAAHRTISLDAEQAEHRFRSEPIEQFTPERAYERQWALTLLETVLQRLAEEYTASGREALFAELRFAITGDKSAGAYAEIAARLAMSEEALRMAVHRLRKRFRQVLREEIAQTVSNPSEVPQELEHLRRILEG